MEFWTEIKVKYKALEASLTEENLEEEEKKQLEKSLKNLKTYSLTGRGLIFAGVIFGIEWKKNVSFLRREIPVVFGTILAIALLDYCLIQQMWSEQNKTIIKYTAYKDGVFFKPKQLKEIREKNGMNMFKIDKQKKIEEMLKKKENDLDDLEENISLSED